MQGDFPEHHPGRAAARILALSRPCILYKSLSDWMMHINKTGLGLMIVGDDPGSTPNMIRRNYPNAIIWNEDDTRLYLRQKDREGGVNVPEPASKEIHPGYGEF